MLTAATAAVDGPDAGHRDTGAVYCRAEVAAVDFNFDGKFDSSDLVAAFKLPSIVWDQRQFSNGGSLIETADLIAAMRANLYEADGACDVNADNQQVVQYEHFYADESAIRELVTYTYEDNALASRTST